MPFDKSGWAVDGSHFNEKLPRMHKYTTTDTQADVNTSGYFNGVASECSVGDTILATVDTDGTQATVEFLVLTNDGTTVDVSDGTAAATTDTD